MSIKDLQQKSAGLDHDIRHIQFINPFHTIGGVFFSLIGMFVLGDSVYNYIIPPQTGESLVDVFTAPAAFIIAITFLCVAAHQFYTYKKNEHELAKKTHELSQTASHLRQTLFLNQIKYPN